MKLIDAEKLVKDLELLAKHEDEFRKSVILGVIHTIKEQPTVDAVRVTRCKDCRHWIERTADGVDSFHVCWFNDSITGKNHYCVYAEKKEGT